MSLAVTEANFESEVLQSDKPVLVDFWAEWCAPCRMLSPVVEQLAGEYANKLKVVKTNVDKNPALAQKFNVQSIPTLLLFHNGQVVKQNIGVAPKDSIVKLFEDFL